MLFILVAMDNDPINTYKSVPYLSIVEYHTATVSPSETCHLPAASCSGGRRVYVTHLVKNNCNKSHSCNPKMIFSQIL